MSKTLYLFDDTQAQKVSLQGPLACLRTFLDALKTQDSAALAACLAESAAIESVLRPRTVLTSAEYIAALEATPPGRLQNLRYTGVVLALKEDAFIARGIIGDHGENSEELSFIKEYVVEIKKTTPSGEWRVVRTSYSMRSSNSSGN